MSKPRIAYILQDFYIGGIETCLYNIASRLRDEFDFTFIATHVKEITPKFYNLGNALHIDKWRALIVYLQKEKFAIAQVHNLRQYADCAAAAGLPVIIERVAGNRAAQNPKDGIDWVVASNVGTLPLIAKNFDLRRVTVIYNGVDIDRINVPAANRFDFSDSDIIIGRVSRIGGGQNLTMLIKAACELNKKYPHVKLVIVGGKSRMPGAANIIPQLQEMSRPLGKNVIFAGEIEEPFGIMKGFDIATCVSNHEGIPNSLLEAMACAKAVVSTEVGQVPELIKNEKNGLLVPCNDTASLVIALERLIVDVELRMRLGIQARKTIEEHFDINKQAEKYRQLYNRLLRRSDLISADRRFKPARKFLNMHPRLLLGLFGKGRDLSLAMAVLRQRNPKNITPFRKKDIKTAFFANKKAHIVRSNNFRVRIVPVYIGWSDITEETRGGELYYRSILGAGRYSPNPSIYSRLSYKILTNGCIEFLIKMHPLKQKFRFRDYLQQNNDSLWVLDRIIKELIERLDYVYCYDEVQDADINYYVNWHAFRKKSSGIDVAWFTHFEARERERFFTAAKQVDYAICHSKKYLGILKDAGLGRSSVVQVGLDSSFVPKLILGYAGGVYSRRKGAYLLSYLETLDWVELRLTEGKLSYEELPNFYRQLDYVFIPSLVEGGPMCLVEGIACGKEVIAPRDVGAVMEYSDSVILYEKGDIFSLEAVLKELYQKKLSIRKPIENQTWDNFAAEHDKIFKSLISRKEKAWV